MTLPEPLFFTGFYESTDYNGQPFARKALNWGPPDFFLPRFTVIVPLRRRKIGYRVAVGVTVTVRPPALDGRRKRQKRGSRRWRTPPRNFSPRPLLGPAKCGHLITAASSLVEEAERKPAC